MRKKLIESIKILAVIYGTILLVFVVSQRSLVYSPTGQGSNTPSQFAVPYQEITIVSQDSTKLNAWWLQHSDSKHRPVLLYCHGSGATLSDLAHVAAMFYKFDWDLLMVDYRNHGKSEDGPTGLSEDGIHADVQAAYDWLRAKGIKDHEIIIWGHSLGSSFAAWLASHNHPAGLVVEGAFPSAYSMARFRYPYLFIPEILIWDKLRTGDYVQNRTFPLLVIHAKNDSVIPVALGKKVFEMANEPKELLVVPGINHNDLPSVIDKYKDHIIELAANWIK